MLYESSQTIKTVPSIFLLITESLISLSLNAMAHVAAEKVAFWELETNDVEQASIVPHPVEPCIRSSGVTDIGIFPEEEDPRVPVDKADIQPGGKYRCSNPPPISPFHQTCTSIWD